MKKSKEQQVNLERKDSISWSPPTKKVKDKSTGDVKVIQNQSNIEKDEEIIRLRAQVKNLKEKLQEALNVKIQMLTKIPTLKEPSTIEANTNIINVVEVEEMTQSFKCEKCGKCFSLKGSLLGHKDCQKETEREPYKWQFKVNDQHSC